MAARYNIKIEQGATYTRTFQLKNKETQEILDLTGCTARMQIRLKVKDANILHSLTTENGGIEIEVLTGKISILISAEDTALFEFKTGVYDLEVVYPTGVVVRLLEGGVGVSFEVTR